MNASHRHAIGVLLFLETHRRILGGEFGSIPRPISDDAFSMAGYVIDAPEYLPAGCWHSEDIDEDYTNVPTETFVERN